MKRLLLMTLLWMWMNAVNAQPFNSHWITCPQADRLSEVWFRQEWNLQDYPIYASVTIGCTGKFNLFVNERNVSTALWMPYRSANEVQPVCINLNITRFLRPGVNVIAVWVAPEYPQLFSQQITLSGIARYNNGKQESITTDENWLTRPATTSLTLDGGEKDDGYAYGAKWNSDDFDVATWQSATAVEGPSLPYSYYFAGYPAVKVSKIQTPRYFDVVGDSVYYQFDKAFKGQVRVTLRGAKRGQKIQFNGLTYTCNGELDEQAYPRFAVKDVYRVLISGDKDFKPEQIQQVEGLEVVPYFHQSYQY